MIDVRTVTHPWPEEHADLLQRTPSGGYTTCLRCGREGYYVNVRQNQYAVCDRCGVFYGFGENLFSSWEHETEETWRENTALLETLEEHTGGLGPEAIRHLQELYGLDAELAPEIRMVGRGYTTVCLRMPV